MVIRSWHCRAHSLDEISSAKGCQLGQKRSSRLDLSTKCHPQTCSQILDSRSFPYSLRTPEKDFGRGSYGHSKLALHMSKNWHAELTGTYCLSSFSNNI